MKRIVIGTDGSADAGVAVESALELARGLGAAVTFVFARVVPSALLGQPYYQQELDAEMARARAGSSTTRSSKRPRQASRRTPRSWTAHRPMRSSPWPTRTTQI